MFDDQPVNKSGGVPPNLPIGELEDVFASVPETAPVAPEEPTQMTPLSADPTMVPPSTDIPEAPSALAAGVLRPAGVTEPSSNLDIPPDPFANVPAPEAAPSAMPSSVPGAAQKESAAVVPPFAPGLSMGAGPAPSGTPQPTGQHQQYTLKEPTLSRGIMTAIIIIIVLVF